ncbi:hypothetical protein BD770DRAFT_203628 [Pilaira anomala]|nr:hypothetical protein BD770DRAFT_203628 [Pilaira anomala]
MDRIILNTIKTTQEGFESKGEGCSCSDRVVYKLPCPCIIDSTSDIIPLTIVDKRWYIELEHGYSLSNRAFTVQRKITEKIINSDVDDTANFSGNSFKSISLDDNADEINEVEEEVKGEEKEGEEEEDVEEEDSKKKTLKKKTLKKKKKMKKQ